MESISNENESQTSNSDIVNVLYKIRYTVQKGNEDVQNEFTDTFKEVQRSSIRDRIKSRIQELEDEEKYNTI